MTKQNILGKILAKPSPRTQLEATITGLVIMLLASLVSSIYVIFFSDYTLFWKIITGLGEVGVLLMLLSNLAMSYVQLYSLKLQMGLYKELNLQDILNSLPKQESK